MNQEEIKAKLLKANNELPEGYCITNAENLERIVSERKACLTLLSKIERGDRLPTFDQIQKIALFFQVPINNLQALLIAQRIIKDYGLNEITIKALELVKQEFSTPKNIKND